MSLHDAMIKIGQQAKTASYELAQLTSAEKNNALMHIARALIQQSAAILDANALDIAGAKTNGVTDALIDRLTLNRDHITALSLSVEKIAELPDPVGEVLSEQLRPNGLKICKTRVPIGVIAVIYESRPNVTIDVAALCLKTGNAAILRGGSEAMHSNRALMAAIQRGLLAAQAPDHAIQLVLTEDRDAVRELVQLQQYVDLVIPRGGEGLINAVSELARVPVIRHYKGVCHTYIDASADLNMALAICENAKCQRPGVCNAMETLLVHQDIAPTFLPLLVEQLQAHNVELRGDERARQLAPSMLPATEDDWKAEYLALILAVKVVDKVADAITHINTYGSHHSDAIVTHSPAAQAAFLQQVDSAVVYVNASTRFTDGGEFGMGAEIGISTDKLHARGPMGLTELTTYKYRVEGSGQTRL